MKTDRSLIIMRHANYTPEARGDLPTPYVIRPCTAFQHETAGLRSDTCQPNELSTLVIRTDESTSRYAIYFHETDQTDKGKKNQAEL